MNLIDCIAKLTKPPEPPVKWVRVTKYWATKKLHNKLSNRIALYDFLSKHGHSEVKPVAQGGGRVISKEAYDILLEHGKSITEYINF